MSSISRTNWPADHVSAEAEPAGLPFSKPIDASPGGVPNGEAARSAASHACSAMRPTPEDMLRIASRREIAAPAMPRSTSYWPRSPASTGHRWPLPALLGVDAHGRPSLRRSP